METERQAWERMSFILPKELEELKALPIWYNYALIPKKKGGHGKPPINPHTLRNASPTNSQHRSVLDGALKNIGKTATVYNDDHVLEEFEVAGVGIALDDEHEYCAIDLDHVFKDGTLTPEAQEIVDIMDTYTEISPSGTGLRIIYKGHNPEKGVKFNGKEDIDGGSSAVYEIYERGKYVTITGNVLLHKPIEERTAQAKKVHAELFTPQSNSDDSAMEQLTIENNLTAEKHSNSNTATLSINIYSEEYWLERTKRMSDFEIIDSLSTKKGLGDRFSRLYSGDWSDYKSQSEGDQALMTILYSALHDMNRAVSIFDQSGLARTSGSGKSSKWSSNRSYREHTIAKAKENACVIVGNFAPTLEERRAYAQMKEAQEIVELTERKKEGERKGTATVNNAQSGNSTTSFNFSHIGVRKYLEQGKFEEDINYFKKYKDRKTGFENLDKHLTLYAGLCALGGSASLGKSTFAVNLAKNLIDRGETVLYFALEQTEIELVTKLLARKVYEVNPYSRINNIDIKNGATSDDLEKAKKSIKETCRNFIIIKGDFKTTVEDIANYVDWFIDNAHIKPVVIIDYLQLIAPTDDGKDTRLSTDHAVETLKALQLKHELFVLLISSFNRSSYTEPVSYESFKETGMIEYTCDYIWGLQLSRLEDDDFYFRIGSQGGMKPTTPREKKEMANAATAKNPKEVELVSLKNRNGKQHFKCFFRYNMPFDIFVPDMASPHNPKWGEQVEEQPVVRGKFQSVTETGDEVPEDFDEPIY